MIQRVMVGYLTLLLIITLVVLPHNSHQTYFNTGDGYKFQQETAEYINNNRDDLLDKIREQRGKVVAVHELKMGESSSSSTKSEELTSGNPFVKRSKQTKTTKRTKWAADQFVTIDALETTDGTTEKDGLEQVILEEFNSDSDFDMAVDDLDTMDLLKYMNNLHKWNSTNVNLDTTLTWLVELEQKLLTHNETTTEIMDKTDVDFKRMIAELEAAKNETCRLQQEVIAHKLQLENTRKEKEYLEKLQRLKQSYELYIQHHNTTTKLWEDYMEQKKDAEKKIEQIEQKLSVIQELKTHIFNIKQRHKLLSIWFAKWKKLVEETDFTIIIPGENATDITINNHTQIIYSNETTVDKIYHKYIDEYENPLIDGNCFCPVAFEPVCGSDGITYSSLCVARCAQVQVMYKSACRCKEEHVDPEEHAQAGANVLYIL